MLGTQHVAGTADVEVLHGNVYTTAQVGEVFDGLQAAACLLREAAEGWGKQVAEGLLVAAAYTSAHLVKVA